MPCESMRQPRQSIQDRADEVRRTVEALAKELARGRVKAVVGKQGAVAFTGIDQRDRNGVTDACIYRRIMSTGSALARSAIQRAELLAGRQVDRQVVGQGTHSHDGGNTWMQKG